MAGLWKHTGSDHVLQNGAQVETGLPGRVLQLGPLFANRLRLDRLRCAHEEAGQHRGRPAGEESAAVGASAPFHVVSADPRIQESDRRSTCQPLYRKSKHFSRSICALFLLLKNLWDVTARRKCLRVERLTKIWLQYDVLPVFNFQKNSIVCLKFEYSLLSYKRSEICMNM